MIWPPRLALLAVFLVPVAGGCQQGVGPDARRELALARGDARVGGDVVSTVDGHPITLAEVEQAAREAGVPPGQALRVLQDELLLARAAERRGFDGASAVERARRQSEVQVLLERVVEAEVGPDRVDPAELEAAFDSSPGRFARPERRQSAHVLAQVSPDAPPAVAAAAEAWAHGKHREIAAAADPLAAILALRRSPPTDLQFEVTVEEVQALERGASVDPAYLAALFSRPDVGLVADPVHTVFGWHIVAITEIEPAWTATHDEALATLRDERVVSLRAEALEALVRRLASERTVAVEHDTLRALLSDPTFLAEPR